MNSLWLSFARGALLCVILTSLAAPSQVVRAQSSSIDYFGQIGTVVTRTKQVLDTLAARIASLVSPQTQVAQVSGGRAPYDLGTLPAEFDNLSWPTAPNTTTNITVSNVSELTAALQTNGARITIEPGTYVTQLSISGSDQELIFEDGAVIAPSGSTAITINNARRLVIRGGEFQGGMYMSGTPSDILLNGVFIDTKRGSSQWADTVEITPSSGSRIAIINSTISAYRYASFVSNVTDFIVANSNFQADGPESTLRLASRVVRAAIVDNRLYNGQKHTFRAHDLSDLIFFARNQLENTGFMFNNMPVNPNVIRAWLYDNTFYHQSNSLMQTGNTTETEWLTAVNNTAYTTSCTMSAGCGETITAHAVWGAVSGNLRFPYQAPPAFDGGAGGTTPEPDPTDTTPPTVTITAPTAGSTVADTTTITASASDNVGVTRVDFYVDGVQQGSDTSAPYSYNWDTTSGDTHACIGTHSHSLTARAHDAAGNMTTSAVVSVTMNDPDYCTEPTPDTPFSAGDRVTVITQSNINVRNTAGLSGTIAGTQASGAIGTILDLTPVSADGFVWVSVDFDSGADGWVADEFLSSYTESESDPVTATFSGWNGSEGYQIGSGENIALSVSGDTSTIDDVVFQVWSEDEGVEGAYVDNMAPYIYLSSALDTVTPGTNRFVQALVRFNDGTPVYTVSESATFTTPPTTPEPTLIFSANPTSITEGESSTLTWSTTNATSCSASGGWTGSGATSGTQSVTPTTNTTYTLTCTGAGGSVERSVTVEVGEPDEPDDTTAPTLSDITVTDVTATQARITFTTDEPAQGTVQYGLTNAYGLQVVNSTLRTNHSAQLTNLTPNTTYHYRVIVLDAAGNMTTSENHTFTTATAPDTTPPSAVNNLTVTNVTENGVTISWIAPGDDGTQGMATAYDLRYSTSPITTTNFSLATPILDVSAPLPAGSSETHTLGGLNPATTYYLALRTSDEANNVSTLSNVPSFTTLTTPTPADTIPPTISSLSSGNTGPTSMDITWNTDEPATSVVRFGTSQANLSRMESSSALTEGHLVTLAGLERRTRYYYRVESTDAAENTAISDILSFQTSNAKPEKVKGLTAKNGSVILSWDRVIDRSVARIEVYRSTDGYPDHTGQPLATIGQPNRTTYTDVDVTPGTTYYYTVYTVNRDGEYSDPAEVSTATREVRHTGGGGGATTPPRSTTPTASPAPTTPTATTPASSGNTFTRNLTLGARGEDVRALQRMLNARGFIVSPTGPGAPGFETNYFGERTRQALIRYQEAHAQELLAPGNLVSGTGFFGVRTRAHMNNQTIAPTSVSATIGDVVDIKQMLSTLLSLLEQVRILQARLEVLR